MLNPKTQAGFSGKTRGWVFQVTNPEMCTVLGMSTTQRVGNTSDWYEICLLTDLYKQENGLSYAPCPANASNI